MKSLTLIGIRDNETLQEIKSSIKPNLNPVKEFPLKSLSEICEAIRYIDGTKQEGFVVVDGNFNRIKIKSPAYVAIHHLRDGNPRKRLMEIIQNGENDEMLSYKILDEWPAEKAMYEEMLAKVETLILQTETFYDTIKEIKDQKEFALQAVNYPLSGALFAVRKGKEKSIRIFILKMHPDKLLDLIDKL
jgi:hypothetical protein